ncbi:MAG: hypothetical protein LKH33_10290 [Acetobacter sp.]|jgi:hypothetical protein|nr:hypothetical protein [Acetobacter sp.]MCH4060528.1 hypothetical protein [Acetobacter sp.]MCH4087468.1 hypothetical protein [Acetobacter sp.]MCI1294669.1 hypothetical protein [Acetobacter sp.]MCI1321182.1 hypothetical protein [Acetobacter sp.]
MTTPVLPFKRGMSFVLSCAFEDSSGAAVDLSDYTLSSQLRDGLDNLVAELDCAPVSGVAGRVNARFVGSTSDWPVGRLFCDMRIIRQDGLIQMTRTFIVSVSESVTREGASS